MIHQILLILQLSLLVPGISGDWAMPKTNRISTVESGKIEVKISGFRNSKGNVVVSLFNKAEGFPKMEKAYKVLTVKIVNQTAIADFDGLTPGKYGIAVFHDENSNNKMDTNFFGIPKEGVGASNGAKGHFGPPKFEDAVFQLGTETKIINIKVAYL